MNEDVFDRPEFKNIDPAKLEMIKSFSSQMKGKTSNQVMTMLMSNPSAMAMANGLSDGEKAALLTAMKMNMSPDELAKFNKIMNMISAMGF